MEKNTQRKKTQAPPTRLINFRATDYETGQLQEKADRHAKGNLSLWIRYAGMYFVPNEADKMYLEG